MIDLADKTDGRVQTGVSRNVDYCVLVDVREGIEAPPNGNRAGRPRLNNLFRNVAWEEVILEAEIDDAIGYVETEISPVISMPCGSASTPGWGRWTSLNELFEWWQVCPEVPARGAE